MWWAATLLAAVALVSGLLAWRAQARAAEALRVELAAAVGQADSRATPPPAPAPVDFTQRLPATAPMDRLLREAFKTAARAGVTVLSAEPRDATAAGPGSLSHAALTLQLAGPYAGVKTVVAELLARFPGLTLQQLRIARAAAGGGGGVEASVTFQQWLRPVAAVSPDAGRK